MSKLSNLERELRAGRLSRRDFLQAATVLGFGAVAPTILSRPANQVWEPSTPGSVVEPPT